MKQYFFLTIIILALASCKKKYTCNCSINVTSQSSSGGGYFSYIVPADKSAYSSKMTKKQAKAACNHQQKTIETDFTNGYTGNGNSPLKSGESIVTTCNIIQ